MIRLAALIAVLLTMAACTRENRGPIAAHSGAQDTRAHDRAQTASPALVKTDSAKSKTSEQLLADLEKLAGTVLSPEYLYVAGNRTSMATKDQLRELNENLLVLMEREPSGDATLKWLERYQSVVRDGCSETLDGCKLLSFFAADPGSTLVF